MSWFLAPLSTMTVEPIGRLMIVSWTAVCILATIFVIIKGLEDPPLKRVGEWAFTASVFGGTYLWGGFLMAAFYIVIVLPILNWAGAL